MQAVRRDDREDAAVPTSLEVPHCALAGEGRAVFVAERSAETWLRDEL